MADIVEIIIIQMRALCLFLILVLRSAFKFEADFISLATKTNNINFTNMPILMQS
jgi:hypothetical protein